MDTIARIKQDILVSIIILCLPLPLCAINDSPGNSPHLETDTIDIRIIEDIDNAIRESNIIIDHKRNHNIIFIDRLKNDIYVDSVGKLINIGQSFNTSTSYQYDLNSEAGQYSIYIGICINNISEERLHKKITSLKNGKQKVIYEDKSYRFIDIDFFYKPPTLLFYHANRMIVISFPPGRKRDWNKIKCHLNKNGYDSW